MSIAEQKKQLGLMGQLLTHDSLIEIFRHPASEFEFRSGKGKLIDIEGRMVREAARSNLEANQSLTPHEEELIMNLSAAYLKKREEGKEDIIIWLLRAGMIPQTIAEMINFPIESIEKLRDRI